MSELRDKINRLIDSDIESTYIERMTGLNSSTIRSIRRGSRPIDGVRFDFIEKVYDFQSIIDSNEYYLHKIKDYYDHTEKGKLDLDTAAVAKGHIIFRFIENITSAERRMTVRWGEVLKTVPMNDFIIRRAKAEFDITNDFSVEKVMENAEQEAKIVGESFMFGNVYLISDYISRRYPGVDIVKFEKDDVISNREYAQSLLNDIKKELRLADDRFKKVQKILNCKSTDSLSRFYPEYVIAISDDPDEVISKAEGHVCNLHYFDDQFVATRKKKRT